MGYTREVYAPAFAAKPGNMDQVGCRTKATNLLTSFIRYAVGWQVRPRNHLNQSQILQSSFYDNRNNCHNWQNAAKPRQGYPKTVLLCGNDLKQSPSKRGRT